MLSLKKFYRDELLQLALIISLLRVRHHSPFESELYSADLDNGTTWRSISPNVLQSHYVHPKSLDSILLDYERDVFADLNSLGRYNRINNNVTAYLLNIERTAGEAGVQAPTEVPEGTSASETTEPGSAADELDCSLGLSQEVGAMNYV